MLEKILVFVAATHFEVIGPGPFRFAFHLVPTVNHLRDLNGPLFPKEAARVLVRFRAGVALNLDRIQIHKFDGPRRLEIE
jgi:hypothetical protein